MATTIIVRAGQNAVRVLTCPPGSEEWNPLTDVDPETELEISVDDGDIVCINTSTGEVQSLTTTDPNGPPPKDPPEPGTGG